MTDLFNYTRNLLSSPKETYRNRNLHLKVTQDYLKSIFKPSCYLFQSNLTLITLGRSNSHITL